MGYRTFTDRNGRKWEIRDRSTSEWVFHSVGQEAPQEIRVRPYGHDRDPFELSVEELQELLDKVDTTRRPRRPSPFKD